MCFKIFRLNGEHETTDLREKLKLRVKINIMGHSAQEAKQMECWCLNNDNFMMF